MKLTGLYLILFSLFVMSTSYNSDKFPSLFSSNIENPKLSLLSSYDPNSIKYFIIIDFLTSKQLKSPSDVVYNILNHLGY